MILYLNITQHTNYNYLLIKNQDIFKIQKPNTRIITPNVGINKHYWRFKSINKDINQLNIDIFHGLSNELPFGINIKSVVTIHDLLFLKYPQFYNFIDRKIYNFKSKYACKKADKIIDISQQTKEDIVNYYNINPNKIEVNINLAQGLYQFKYKFKLIQN